MQRRQGEKVHGPYQHGQRWRCHLVGGDGKRRYRSFATRDAAETYAAAARGEAQGRTVSAAVEAFLARKTELDRAPATIESYDDRLRAMLSPVWDRPLRAIANRGAELYGQAQTGPRGRRAADTHQNALAAASSFGRWCVKRRWLKADPFADVEPVGRKALGADKAQLTVDESRRLRAWCLSHSGDPDAVLTLAYLELGMRASELVGRCVRDLDDDGHQLRIGKTKTPAGRRRLLIADQLREALLGLAADRPQDAPLFAHLDGSPWSRHVAYGRVRRACAAAEVTVLPPQALRRTQATLATEAGATGLMVAAHLGHDIPAPPAVTHRSYVAPEAARDAQVQRAFRVITGGRG